MVNNLVEETNHEETKYDTYEEINREEPNYEAYEVLLCVYLTLLIILVINGELHCRRSKRKRRKKKKKIVEKG